MNIQNQTFYSGVVENRNDPLFLGRCQVRVVGLHTEDKVELPTEMLPWAYPMAPIISASMNGIGHSPLGPVEGTWVMVVFRDLEKQQPIMIGTVGGIPQQDNNADIERDDDNYLLNVDEGEVFLTASGVPVRITTDGVLVGGEVGSALEGRSYLASAVNELKATLDTATNNNVVNLSRVGVAGPALASMSSYSSQNGRNYGTANNAPGKRVQYDIAKTMDFLNSALPGGPENMTTYQMQLMKNQYDRYQSVGALTYRPPDTVSNQISALQLGYNVASNVIRSSRNFFLSDAQRAENEANAADRERAEFASAAAEDAEIRSAALYGATEAEVAQALEEARIRREGPDRVGGALLQAQAVRSSFYEIQGSANRLSQSFRDAADVASGFGNLPVLSVSGLSGFDNLQFYKGQANIEVGGIVGGLTKAANQINQGVQKVNREINRVGEQVGKITDKVTNVFALGALQISDSAGYGQAISDRYFSTAARYGTQLGSDQTRVLSEQDRALGLSDGLTDNQKLAVGAAANVVLSLAMRNPKFRAVANALITTKKSFDVINNVIGKYTAPFNPIAGVYYSPLGTTNLTRAISASNLFTGLALGAEIRPTNITAFAAERAAEIARTGQDIAATFDAVSTAINDAVIIVQDFQRDVGAVVGAVASTAGAWTHVGNAFGKQRRGGASLGGGIVLSSGKLEVQFNKYDIITIVGLMGVNELLSFRDAMGLYKSLSIPDAPINFNVNGVVGGQNYGVVSPIGELGKYQVNAEQLAQLGYVRYLTNVKGERVFPSNFRLASESSWTGKSGMTSIQKFVSTPSVQEKVMNEITAYNYDQLILDGIITPATTVAEIGGYLSIAHNTGIFAVRQFVNGENVINSRGQSAFEAYQLGHTAIKGGQATVTPGLQPPENPDPNQVPLGEVGADGRVSLGRPTDKTESIGFRDPNRKYPLGSKLNEPDTNRLSRNQFIGGTVVDLKDARRDRKVPIGGIGATWDEPPSPYDALYPFNHTYQSESGHIVEYDDTPNRERMHWYHARGTFMEWDANGTSVRKIVGDGYEIFERNGFIHVKGECNLTVDGNCNVMVKSNANIEVLGTTQGYFRNDFNAEVSGNMNLSVKESFQLKAKNIHFETTGTRVVSTVNPLFTDGFMRIKLNGPYVMSAEGDINVTARNNLYQQAGDRVSMNAGNNMYLYGNNNLNLFSLTGAINSYATTNISSVSAGTMYLNAGAYLSVFTTGVLGITGAASASLGSGGPTFVNGLTVQLGIPGVPGIPAPPTPLTFAQVPSAPLDSLPPLTVLPAVPILPARNILDITDISNALLLPTPSARGTPVNPQYDIMSLPPRGASRSQVFESPDEGSEKDFVEQQIKRGKINQNEPATSQEETVVEQRAKQARQPACASFANVQNFPLSTKLSPNFYLGDFIPGGGGKYICQASTPQTLRDIPGGFTKQQIVCNLKGFAENIMERVITVVPKQDIVVTSGWRYPGSIGANESANSDHGAGGAVDIILRSYGNDRRKHYDLIQRLQNVLPYDQLILEYENGKKGSLVWIHIGHRSWQSSQRGRAFTMNNHSTFKNNGFALLT